MTKLQRVSNSLLIAGIDEVGRGCLFGPVFAAVVVLDKLAEQQLWQAGLNDSKKLSAKQRSELVPVIRQESKAWGLGQASAGEIDVLGIRGATEQAMLRALQKLPQSPNLVLVDGKLRLRLWNGPQQVLVAGDSYSAAIAAASVLAKEVRDALIRRLALRFPGYSLERNVGYGTALHRKALLDLGPTSLHRNSFLRRLLA
ncbi:ribonuclease HII [Synechococcus sp. M16CYN]|uniref:ribonuclease HII n=1 Tax=Synechococcus sp. M16CYN TaxID=3103139 RepID=UPI0032554788